MILPGLVDYSESKSGNYFLRLPNMGNYSPHLRCLVGTCEWVASELNVLQRIHIKYKIVVINKGQNDIIYKNIDK